MLDHTLHIPKLHSFIHVWSEGYLERHDCTTSCHIILHEISLIRPFDTRIANNFHPTKAHKLIFQN